MTPEDRCVAAIVLAAVRALIAFLTLYGAVGVYQDVRDAWRHRHDA